MIRRLIVAEIESGYRFKYLEGICEFCETSRDFGRDSKLEGFFLDIFVNFVESDFRKDLKLGGSVGRFQIYFCEFYQTRL